MNSGVHGISGCSVHNELADGYISALRYRRFFKGKSRKKKAAAASGIGALWVAVTIYARFKHTLIIIILTYLGVSSLMVFICFEIKSIKQLIRGVLVLYISAFVFGGILNTIYFNLGLGRIVKNIIRGRYGYTVILIILSFFIMIIICSLLKKYEQQIVKKDNTYYVTLFHNERSVELKALYDTGNTLLEPVTGRPVSVCCLDPIKKLLNDDLDKFKNIFELACGENEIGEKVYVVPFRSIGNESGIIAAVEISVMHIHIRGKTVEIKKPLIGLYNGSLNGDSSYDMILNSAVMSNYIKKQNRGKENGYKSVCAKPHQIQNGTYIQKSYGVKTGGNTLYRRK